MSEETKTGKAKATDKAKPSPAAAASSYTKEQLLKSQKYKPHRDLLNALLNDGDTYTRAKVDALIDGYMTGETEPVFHRHGRDKNGRRKARTGRQGTFDGGKGRRNH